MWLVRVTQALVSHRKRLEMIMLNISQPKMDIYLYIWKRNAYIHIYMYINKITNQWNSLPQHNRCLDFIHVQRKGGYLKVGATSSQLGISPHFKEHIKLRPSKGRRKCYSLIAAVGIISTFSLRLPGGVCGKPDQVDYSHLTALSRCTSGLLSGPKPILGSNCPRYLAP